MAAKKTDAKSEFLMELAELRAKWAAKGCREYAAAYERMLCVFTTPTQPSAKKNKTT